VIGRMAYDVSEEALERCRREQLHMQSWGTPARCRTRPSVVCPLTGDCLRCGAWMGENCKELVT
jgi:hypothetical protein